MSDSASPRVGLVLGGGGVLGGAWLVGALHAIATETGWDPGSADYVVGTSAGSMVGSLISCGVPPWFMVAHSAGAVHDGITDARGESASGADRSAGARYRLHRGLPLGPGSWRLGLASLARPYRYSPSAVVAGWIPNGLVSTEPLKDTVRRACGEGSWAPHPNFWAMAVDYETGRRVAFGREDAPEAELPDAVAASCAIPGFYRAVTIGGRRYVDGGVRSTSNLDVLRDEKLDLVIALNPTSSLHEDAGGTPGERIARVMRQASGRRLGSEAKRMRAAGVEVALIQPTVHDLDAMGTNLMSRARRNDVIETAVDTVTAHLRESPLGERLSRLPAGQPALVRKPSGSRRDWPSFQDLARGRWARRQRVA